MVGGSCAWSSVLVSRTLAAATADCRILAVGIPLLGLEVRVQEMSIVEVGAVAHISKVLARDPCNTHFLKIDVWNGCEWDANAESNVY